MHKTTHVKTHYTITVMFVKLRVGGGDLMDETTDKVDENEVMKVVCYRRLQFKE